jgi:hypothetical protein
MVGLLCGGAGIQAELGVGSLRLFPDRFVCFITLKVAIHAVGDFQMGFETTGSKVAPVFVSNQFARLVVFA